MTTYNIYIRDKLSNGKRAIIVIEFLLQKYT